MYTVEQIPVGKSCEGHNRPDGAGFQSGDRQEKEDCGTRRCRYPFLTVPVTEKAPQSVVKQWRDGEWYELISRENYEYLRDSYLRYAGLLGMSVSSSPCGIFGEDIVKVYKAMKALVGDDIGVNIEQDAGRLKFRLWKHLDWRDTTMYYFPVKFIRELNPELRHISATFMHDLMTGNGMNTVLECGGFDYVMEGLFNPGEEPSKEAEERARLRRSYKKGAICRLLKSIGRKRHCKDLARSLDRYKPQNGYEKDLVDLMGEGSQFLYPEKPLLRYAYDPYFREKPEFDPIGLEEQVMVVYDSNDAVTKSLIGYYDSYYPETYAVLPMDTLDLSPDTDRLFSTDDDYPTRFYIWADRFIECITS